MARKIEVEVVGDTAAFERAMRRSAASTRQFGGSFAVAESSMARFAKRAAFTAGAAGLGALALGTKSAISAASNLNESINAVNVTFGKAGERIAAFGKTAAATTGLSARQVNESATVLGAALQNVGFSADDAATRTIALTQRAADMASVFNTDVDQALGAIQAALRGESDPIERFGVGLNEAAVSAKALELGLAKTTKEVTAQDKAQARLALIMEQTNKVAGDFANTSDGAANQQRILRAEVENLSAKIGTKLLPVVSDVLSQVLEWTTALEENEQLQRDVEDAVRDVIDVSKRMADIANDVAEAFGGWGNALKIALGIAVFKKLADLATALGGIKGTAGGAGGAGGTGALGVASVFRLAWPLAIAAGVGQALKNFKPLQDALDSFIDRFGNIGGELPSGTGGITLIGPDGRKIDARGRSISPGSAGATGRLVGGSKQQEQVLGFARQFGPGSGITYTWGGVSPQTGFDCSGYLWAAYKSAGITIPRDSRSQWNDPNAMHVPPGQERPGDGVYFVGSRGGRNAGPPPGHVGIYIGGGKFIEYFSSGKPAKVSTLGSRGDYMGARRWLKIASSSTGGGKTRTPAPATGFGTADVPETGGGATTTHTRSRDFQAIPIGLRNQLREAELTKGDADNERILRKIRANLRAQLDNKKIKPEDRGEVLDALKSINSEIERLEDKHTAALKAKAAKKREAMLGAFKGVAAAALKEFDKVTAVGLAQFDALTPAEKELEEFRKRRADEERAQRRLEAMAIEDPFDRAEALRRLDLEDQESALEERARLEREARNKEKDAYEEKRAADRDRLQSWLDDQEKALGAGTKSWEKFYKDLRAIAIRYGFPVGDIKAPAATQAAARAATSGILFPPTGSAAGGHVFDSGGSLAPGINVVYNRTGRAERLVPADRSTSTPTVVVNVYGSVTSERDLAATISAEIIRQGKSNGGGMLGGQA